MNWAKRQQQDANLYSMAKAYGTSGDDDDGIGFTFKLNQIINALNGVSYFFPYHVLSYNRDRSIVSHCNNLIVASFVILYFIRFSVVFTDDIGTLV